nr:hypothetical protein BaRGS_033105 [Batillaria attramentaria]
MPEDGGTTLTVCNGQTTPWLTNRGKTDGRVMCYSIEQQCDVWYHCASGADEWECIGGLICVPVFLRCNGVYDCPGHEDEVECDDYSCPGHYRCRASSVCVHPTHVCDGVQQCPQQDDELFCYLTCPESCTCHGLAFVCTGLFDAHNYTELPYLDASGAGMTPRHLSRNTMLVHLSLARCNITQIDSLSFPILRILDLSDNQLASVDNDDLRNVSNLRVLSLAGNPLTSLFFTSTSHKPLPGLITLDLSRVIISELDLSIVCLFTELQTLNLSGSGVERVLTTVSQLPPSLRELDIRGCAVFDFPRNFFTHLNKLETVQADNYKLCCPAMLPLITPPVSCSAPSDEISSCDDLLRSNLYRFFLSVFAFLALLADFIMGLYLSVIGVADHVSDFTGHDYAFGVMIVLNFILFVMIAADDADPLTAVISGMSEKLDQLTAQLQAQSAEINALKEQDPDVAFTAVVSASDVENLVSGQTLIFDGVVMNEGSGYNPSTGVFTAPYEGTYVFYTRVMRNYVHEELIQTAIYKGSTRLGGWADACCHGHDSGSTMVTVNLNKGEEVHVQIYSGSQLWGGHTTFTGFKL